MEFVLSKSLQTQRGMPYFSQRPVHPINHLLLPHTPDLQRLHATMWYWSRSDHQFYIAITAWQSRQYLLIPDPELLSILTAHSADVPAPIPVDDFSAFLTIQSTHRRFASYAGSWYLEKRYLQ